MSATGDKIRLAVGAFYEAERLSNALADFHILGLTCDEICLLSGEGVMQEALALAQHQSKLEGLYPELLTGMTSLDDLLSFERLTVSGGGALQALRSARSKSGTSCLESLLAGEFGRTIRSHIRNGAIIAAARADTPALQDQCVRALLRHSLHTVHSQECGYHHP